MLSVDFWYIRKNDFWKQLSRDKYAKEMDSNSKYFHSVASFKKKKKQLMKLSVEGMLVKDLRRIKLVVRMFFMELYKQKQMLCIKIENGLV